jgi:hypothetical protein
MNVIQTLESFDYITFVDEYTVMNRKVLNARRGQEVLSLYDIRKINETGPISPELAVVSLQYQQYIVSSGLLLLTV